VRLALTAKVAVLTGGPDCGKSFTVRPIVELAAAKKPKILLMAPTGRAAKRLAELTRQLGCIVGTGSILLLFQIVLDRRDRLFRCAEVRAVPGRIHDHKSALLEMFVHIRADGQRSDHIVGALKD